MTHEEAIEYLKDPIGKGLGEHDEAVRIAVEAIEYRIPKKPVATKYFYGEVYSCPVCSSQALLHYGNRVNFCQNCGQKINWGG